MDEYIKRQAAIEAAMKDASQKRTQEFNGGCARAANNIKRIPAADVVEVRHGRWILDDETGVPICSECHSGKPTKCVCSSVIQHTLSNYEIRYCYFCGAKMDGGAQ